MPNYTADQILTMKHGQPYIQFGDARPDHPVIYAALGGQPLKVEGLSAPDRAKVDAYLSSVREVEQRVQNLEESSQSLENLPDAPVGAPDDFGELLDVQFELFALAWETNRTNVVTMKMTGMRSGSVT